MKSKYLKLGFLFAILIVIGIGSFLVAKNNNQHEEDVHLHAGFVVYKDNEQVDFSDPKYMLIEPCSIEENHEDEEDHSDDPLKAVHLHDLVGDVVHVEAEGIKWSNLFENLEYEINYSVTKGIINGEEVDNFHDKIIQPYDSLVVLIGDNDDIDDASSKAITTEYIKEIEAKGEDCG